MLEKSQTLTVGVADHKRAVDLWVDIIGYEIVALRTGQDEQHAKQWDIPAVSVLEQVLLGYADSSDGRILLVKTADAGPFVRAEAALFDKCAKNVDIYVTNVL